MPATWTAGLVVRLSASQILDRTEQWHGPLKLRTIHRHLDVILVGQVIRKRWSARTTDRSIGGHTMLLFLFFLSAPIYGGFIVPESVAGDPNAAAVIELSSEELFTEWAPPKVDVKTLRAALPDDAELRLEKVSTEDGTVVYAVYRVL